MIFGGQEMITEQSPKPEKLTLTPIRNLARVPTQITIQIQELHQVLNLMNFQKIYLKQVLESVESVMVTTI